MTGSDTTTSAAPRRLRVSSLMADNLHPVLKALCADADVGAPPADFDATWAHPTDWQDTEHSFDCGDIDVAAVCGLGFVHRYGRDQAYRIIAAPVPREERYDDRPRYFSHVVTRADEPVGTLEDLAGRVWASNEPGSHSGYNLIRATLSDRGLTDAFFSTEVVTGSHVDSADAVRRGLADGATIDSTVWDAWDGQTSGLKIVETLGPSTIPPVVSAPTVTPEEHAVLVHRAATMHQHSQGRAALAAAGLSRLVPIAPAAYRDIWVMNEKAREVMLAAAQQMGPAVRDDRLILKRAHLLSESLMDPGAAPRRTPG